MSVVPLMPMNGREGCEERVQGLFFPACTKYAVVRTKPPFTPETAPGHLPFFGPSVLRSTCTKEIRTYEYFVLRTRASKKVPVLLDKRASFDVPADPRPSKLPAPITPSAFDLGSNQGRLLALPQVLFITLSLPSASPSVSSVCACRP